MVGFLPFLFKGMGPHELPVAEVVYLAPLLLGRDAGQVLLPSLKKDVKQNYFKTGFQSFQKNKGERHDTYKCEVSLEQSNPGSVEENQSSLIKESL